MTHEALELVLYAQNTNKIFFEIIKTTINLLAQKYRKGTYKEDLALKAWYRVACVVAQKYHKEYCSNEPKWYYIFTVAHRKEAASYFLETYKEEEG